MGYGQKGWVQRIQKMVFILVPNTASEKDVVNRARVACRVAYNKGLQPIYPPLFYYPFLTDEESTREMERNAQWWLRRVSKLWLLFPFDDEDTWRLDAFTYDVLIGNQGPHKQHRLPICQLHPHGESYLPVAMSREEVDTLLMVNATAGLTGMEMIA
jgi:hypothetical protein